MADRSAISLEEFKARLPIAEVVGRHVRLTRRGHELWGCCPFHKEKTASFHVVPDKGFYHCFGCQQHGNAIDFVMATEGLEFAEAVARLAELTGLPLPWRAATRGPAPDQTLFAANDAPAGRTALKDALLAEGYAEAQLIAAGLLVQPEDGSGARTGLGPRSPTGPGSGYDRFRHRV